MKRIEQLGLTDAEVCRRADVKPSTLTDRVAKLVTALNWSLNQLYDGTQASNGASQVSENFCDQSQTEQLVEVLKLIERLCGPENTNDDPYRDIRVVVRLALWQQRLHDGRQNGQCAIVPTQAGQPHNVGVGYGKLIKAARLRSKVSQQKLADAIGVSKGAISQWETETGAPNRANARKVAEELGIDRQELVARLIGGSEEQQ